METSKGHCTAFIAFLLSSAGWIGVTNPVEAADVAQPGPAFTVNTIDEHDDGVCGEEDCALYEAVAAANADVDANDILFADGLTGTITTDKLTPVIGLTLNNPVTITGPGARRLTVSGNHAARGFSVNLENEVKISGLAFKDCATTIDGGAIDNYSNLTVIDCTFSGNATDGFGGAVKGENGSSTAITGCTFSDNTAAQGGGAIFGGSYLSATNCTFFNNMAAFGGAIHDSGGPAVLTNCTITGNHALESTAAPGGLGGGPSVQVGGCIIAGNTSGDSTTPDIFGFLTSTGYNLIGASGGPWGFTDGENHDHVGTIDMPLNPGFNPKGLQNNGGSTDTIGLFSDSLAVNAGNPANAPERDQREYDRVDAPDIGAFEFGGTIARTLANISTRLRVGIGDNVLIGGFIVTGTHPKQVLLRAIGPSLSLAGKLANPILELRDSAEGIIASNDDWQTNPNKQAIIDTGIPPVDPLESALFITLNPGAYTAIVTGANNGTGIGLIEAYDLDRTTDARLANVSTRGLVQTGDNVMIGGFIVLGSEDEDVLVRAIGPSLPLSNVLADPVLELYDSNGATLAVNDNWRETQQDEIEATGIPPTDEAESAILMALPPGGYTAILRGAGDTTGVALVESYGLN